MGTLCESRSIWFILSHSVCHFALAWASWILLTLFITGVVFHMDSEQRRNRLTLFAALILILVCVERSMRVAFPYLLYHGRASDVRIYYNCLNLMGMTYMWLTLIFHGSKLREAFKGSMYAVTESESRLLRSMAQVCGFLVYGYGVLLGVYAEYGFFLVRLMLVGFAGSALVISLLHYFLVCHKLVTRLKSLVSATSELNRLPRVTPSATDATVAEQQIQQQRQRVNTIDEVERPTMDHVDSHSPSPPSMMIPRLSLNRHSSILDVIRRPHNTPNMDRFSLSNRILLQTAAKSSVLSLWFCGGTGMIAVFAALYSFANCLNYYTLIWDLFIDGGLFINVCCVYLSAKHAQSSYQFCCQRCHRLVLEIETIDL